MIVIAHNIRSAHNIGSIFRTADGAGAEKLFLTGYTPLPATIETVYMTRAHKDIAKTALGAEKILPWEHVESIETAMRHLRKEGYTLVALEQHERSVTVWEYQPPSDKIALFVGNEVDGVEASVLEACDAIVEIPMRGQKNSLNVSVAFGVAAFELYEKINHYEKK